jgi:enterochelin esterase-like enzyme
MKTIFTTVLCCLLVFSLSAQGEVVSTTFSSSSLDGEEFNLNVYLPEGYNENADPYPLYIFLHGCCGLDHNTHIADFEVRLNTLIASEAISPLIVAFPSVQGFPYGNRHMWYNSEVNGPYADLITEDLLGMLSENYKVSGELRAVGGFSMGADGALRIGMYRSDLFQAAISHSSFPALDHILTWVPGVLDETGQSQPPYDFAPSNGFFTEIFFALSAGWSPNPDSAPYYADFLVGVDGEPVDSVFRRWKASADIDSLIRQQWDVSEPAPLSIYFDKGADEALLGPPNDILNGQLSALSAEGYAINYQYLTFPGGHALPTARIDSSLLWLNRVFESALTSETPSLPAKEMGLYIYPNPVSGERFRFGVEGCPGTCIQKVQVADQMGKVLHTALPDRLSRAGQDFTLKLPALPGGLYLLMVETSEGLLSKKFVIK